MRFGTERDNHEGLQKKDIFTLTFKKAHFKAFVLILVVTAVAATAALLGQRAFAGSGKLEDGRLNLSISIRSNATDATISDLENRFQQASELLFDATDGQHQFGTLRICNNSRGGKNADIWIPPTGSPAGCSDTIDNDGDGRTDEEFPDTRDNDGDGRVDEDTFCFRSYVPGSCVPGLGAPDCQIMLFQDDALAPSNGNADGRHIIVHEFGHYGYGIFDEYVQQDATTPAECLEPPFTPESLMENFWARPISEFCVDDNHDPDSDTWQDTVRGESSWETMARFFPDLTIPTGLPNNDPPAGAATINWIELEPESRAVLVIDRSGSMGSPPDKIENAKSGAKLFTDRVSIGDRLGVVSFADTATVDFPLTAVADGTKDAAKAAIDGLTAEGSTSIGRGLRAALNEILAAGNPACQQVIVLLSNGMQNIGEDPSAVIPDLQNAGIIVHTIGLGADADISSLSNIASQTNGRFFFAETRADLQNAFSTLFTESTENGGQITSALAPVAEGELIEELVTLDDLTPETTFLITWPGTANIDLALVAPDGTEITPDTADTDPNITFISDTNHELYTVLSPQAGEWTMRIRGVEVIESVEVAAQAQGISTDISFAAVPNKESFVFPEPILVNATPMASVNVVGATINGTVTRPGGSSVALTLFDDGLESHGDVAANDGMYSNFFSRFNEDGAYSFELVLTTSGGFLFSGEGLFAFPDLGFIPPTGASTVPAPTFTRTDGFSVVVSGVPPPPPSYFGPASFIPFRCNDGRLCAIYSQVHKEETRIPTIQYYMHISRILQRSLDLADKEHVYNNLKPGQEPMLISKMQEALTGGFQKAEQATVQLLHLISKLSELIDTLVSVAGGRVNLPAGLVMGSLNR
jgi:hypothetical protein